MRAIIWLAALPLLAVPGARVDVGTAPLTPAAGWPPDARQAKAARRASALQAHMAAYGKWIGEADVRLAGSESELVAAERALEELRRSAPPRPTVGPPFDPVAYDAAFAAWQEGQRRVSAQGDRCGRIRLDIELLRAERQQRVGILAKLAAAESKLRPPGDRGGAAPHERR